MATEIKPSLGDLEKPESAAAPVPGECASTSGAFINPGASSSGSLPTNDAWPSSPLEPWEAELNRVLWQAGDDGTLGWRSQADGIFE